jgi:hypothetical protein
VSADRGEQTLAEEPDDGEEAGEASPCSSAPIDRLEVLRHLIRHPARVVTWYMA